MNMQFSKNYFLPAGCMVFLSQLALFLPGGQLLAQTAADYSVEPPFSDTDGRTPSGSSSTISSVEASGTGALYQATYYKSYTDAETARTITWGSDLYAVFMDESGRFREDNGIKGKLENSNIDYVVDFFTDMNVVPARTRFRRFQQTGTSDDLSLDPVGVAQDMEILGTIWNARNMLADINQDDVLIQRPLTGAGAYAEDAARKRFIFTWLDALGRGDAGEINPGEIVDFVSGIFDPNLNDNWRYLGLSDHNDAMNLIKFVRGQDVSGSRNRLIDLRGDDSDEERHWVLGDIINSAPLAVGPPEERYDLVYGDTTYKKFKDQYSHRRQMIYLGANDGMLHAFNGGVWNSATRSFQTEAFADPDVFAQGHQLGAEMWAYVPMNLLPHLQWLKDPDYEHVYFVDGSPQAFDVNIFADDATHPGGWGTILVTGMRLGGGAFIVDLDGDSNPETTRRSAVIVADITDPEKPPVLLAELTAPGLNFTTSAPTVVKARRPDSTGSYSSPAMNKWVLVMGSGPDDLATATSDGQKPMLIAWDLASRKYLDLSADLRTPAADPPGFYGNFASVDRNKDYVDDALYVGTSEGTAETPAGRLKRISLNGGAPAFGLADGTASISTLLDVGRPVVARPSFSHSYTKNEDWLLFGTGRSFTLDDYSSVSGQGLFGIKDQHDADSTLEFSSLVDASDIIVQVAALGGSKPVWDGQPNSPLVIDDVQLHTFDDLFAFMDNKPGWYKTLRIDQAAEKVVADALLVRSSAIFTSFLPAPGDGENTGESFIYALNYRTGTADAIALMGIDTAGVVRDSVSAGKTELAEPVIYVVQGNDPRPGEIAAGDSEGAGEQPADTISLVVGTDEGGQKNLELEMPPAAPRRISWELLELAF